MEKILEVKPSLNINIKEFSTQEELMKFIDDKYYSIGLDPHLPFLFIAANKEDQEKRIDFNTTLGRWDIFGTFYL
mgnify:CR=1 FL=1|jgi:hypothetical protein